MSACGRWLPTLEFAKIVGISEQKARRALARAHDGHTWRSHHLHVVVQTGRGGTGGRGYFVEACSLPENTCSGESTGPLRSNADIPAVPPPIPRSRISGTHKEAEWKLSIIRPILNTSPRSPERAAVIEAVAAERHIDWKGRGRTLHPNSLRNWLANYEARVLEGLARKARDDGGRKRVVLSRSWDDAMRKAGADSDAMAAIVAKVVERIRSEWRSGTPSWPTVRANCRPFLIGLSVTAGLTMPDMALHKVCTVPRRMIERERQYALVAMMENDDAAFSAKVVPRIRRDRSHLKPMDWVAADVHHIDVLVRRADGTTCTPKMVAWVDLATNRVFANVFIMPKGEMIRREHVIASYVDMAQDPEFGVPSRIYADRGGEYNWAELTDDLAKLKHRTELRDGNDADVRLGVQRAKPYNPQAKVIEGIFASLEAKAFSQLPGYIGGERMCKKTQNQGKEPMPFPGDEDAFKQAFTTAIRYWHALPQPGTWTGSHPWMPSGGLWKRAGVRHCLIPGNWRLPSVPKSSSARARVV